MDNDFTLWQLLELAYNWGEKKRMLSMLWILSNILALSFPVLKTCSTGEIRGKVEGASTSAAT